MVRRVLVVVAAYAVLAAAVVGWGWLLTHPLEGPVDGFDDDLARWAAGERRGWLDPVAEGGTLLGETVVGMAVAAAVAVAASALLGSLRPAVLLALATGGAGGIYWLGTHADPRDRPPVRILDAGLVPDHSFPSGHVGTAVVVYGSVALLLAAWRSGRAGAGTRLVVALLVLLPPFVAASRIYEGAHHLTDVGTSLVYGTVWLAVLRLALGSGAWTPRPGSTAPATATSSST